MQISALIIGLALFTAAFVFVSRSFWEKRKKGVRNSTATKHTHEQHEATLAAIRDLDFDYRTGKVSEEDCQPLRAQLLVEAAKFMDEQKQEDEQLEAMIQSRRQTAHHTKCEHCGAAMDAGQKFCSKWGTKVEIQMKAAGSS